MAEAKQNDFENLWQQAIQAPEVQTIEVENKVTIDLSIEHVLDRYTDFARKAAAGNKISHSKYLNLKKQTKRYKKALAEIDDGLFLDELKSLTNLLNPFD